jgi:FGGY-family pentulose kinase
MEDIYLGIDVGTGSVRVGAFDFKGYLKGVGKQDIKIWRPRPNFVEQSSEDIWKATGQAIGQALWAGKIKAKSVRGMSFDATCSLVALANEFEPITVSPTGNHEQNIIVWMDHRAVKQAHAINRAGHEVLQYVGGTISPEMQPPKLMWLKANLLDTWTNAFKLMDLADYLVYRATGNDRRSLCTSVCKWTYLGHEGSGGHFDTSFFKANQIEDLFHNDRVPFDSYPMGELAGELTEAAAQSLGLTPGIAVGVGIIDAHAGGIGSLGSLLNARTTTDQVFDRAIALIGGTSSCHMAVSRSPRFIEGIWGPYFGAMLPQMWLNEGGQSATGSLIDYVIQNNASFGDITKAAQNLNTDVYTYLNQTLERLISKQGLALFDTRHILPDHHGNRSPRADPGARGMLTGLTLDISPDEVAIWYGATIHALAYGTREIIEAMNAKGYAIDQIYMCGGHLKNQRFIQDHATITGCQVIIPEETEAVLLGSAILGTVAAGAYQNIFEAVQNMCHPDQVIEPDPDTKPYHDVKYGFYKEMADFQKKIHTKMVHASAGGKGG